MPDADKSFPKYVATIMGAYLILRIDPLEQIPDGMPAGYPGCHQGARLLLFPMFGPGLERIPDGMPAGCPGCPRGPASWFPHMWLWPNGLERISDGMPDGCPGCPLGARLLFSPFWLWLNDLRQIPDGIGGFPPGARLLFSPWSALAQWLGTNSGRNARRVPGMPLGCPLVDFRMFGSGPMAWNKFRTECHPGASILLSL